MHRLTFPRKLALAVTAAVLAATAGMAGPLEPPPGPVTSTGRFGPRTDVATLPGDATATRVISQPGSYYLSGNLTGQAGRSGIRIDANGVTLDLSGYSLVGVPGSLAGISLGIRENIAIHSGMILDWGGDGIGAVQVDSMTVRDVKAFRNAGWGIALPGFDVTVSGCTVTSNTGAGGVRTDDTGLVTGSIVAYNSGDGIALNTSGSVLDNVITDNSGFGIRCGSDCLIRGNLVQFNGVNIGAVLSTIIDNHP